MKIQKSIIAVVVALLICAVAIIVVWVKFPNKQTTDLTNAPVTELKTTPITQLFEKLIIPENAGGGRHPQLFHPINGAMYIFYLTDKGVLQYVKIDEEGNVLDEPRAFSTGDAEVTSFELEQTGDNGFLVYERNNAERREFVLEKINDRVQSSGTAVIAGTSLSNAPLKGKEDETFASAHIFTTGDILNVITQIHGTTAGKQLRLRRFTPELAPVGEAQDLATGDRALIGAAAQAGFETGKGFSLLTTMRLKGTELCPAPDQTTQTEIMALNYDQDGAFLDRTQLTQGSRLTHHPIAARTHNGKIFTAFYVHESTTGFPACSNGDIPIAGSLNITVFNANLAEINKAVLRFTKSGTPGPADIFVSDEAIYAAYELNRTNEIAGPRALMFAKYDF
ncbi:MAG: hypothetical protein A3F54_02575 [Candidatus Kerfeldbacteria bacterium RIFCSPHIGHO2_12_FULL_48_17]|uniref:Uncharacterized protein n=1 Tax=Candidatus Kerfeldbacteria bacterium RIFCSPHIGHO2_12_FULL_48_17 TaxID=1798542 RepID=A0A1G2AYH4_9BACT|nr:MAG: hypothetical protein A3F54_02575 [Candidatus Kerfeldbacteria bacterium RIFCSPHIGHO2_12_FULL_48_17]